MSYTLFDSKTGYILGVVSDISQYKGFHSIPGIYNEKQYIIKNGKPVKKPNTPQGKSWYVHVYNPNTNEYDLNIGLTANKARSIRNSMFKYVDKVNPIWLASMNAVQQLQVANFRQDLLDVTKQPNFPLEINWPVVPDILK